MNTGAGFGFPGKKWKWSTCKPDPILTIEYIPTEPIIREANYYISRYEEGKRAYPVFSATFKDEPISMKKKMEGRTRIIAACNYSFLLVTRMFYLPFIAFMQVNNLQFEMAVGINADGPEWTDFVNHLLGASRGQADLRYNRIIAGDFKGWDRSVLNSIFMNAAFQALISMISATSVVTNLQCLWGVATDICYASWNYFGEYLSFRGTNPSGQGLTVIINSIVNSLIMRYFYIILWFRHHGHDLASANGAAFSQALKDFEEEVIFVSYGDDNIMSSLSDFFTFRNISQVAAEHGIEYTDPNKQAASYDFVSLDQASFLKRSFVKPSYSKYWYAPLDKEVLAKMSQVYIPRTLSQHDHMVEILSAKDRFAYKHGREYHAVVRAFVLECASKMGHSMLLPTFEEYHRADFGEEI